MTNFGGYYYSFKNCGHLRIPFCQMNKDPRDVLIQNLKSEKLSLVDFISDYLKALNIEPRSKDSEKSELVQPSDCPPYYQNINGLCLAHFPFIKVSILTGLCSGSSSDLVSFR